MIWLVIKYGVVLAIGFIAGLLVGRKNPKLEDAVHDEGKEIIEDIKAKLKK